MDTKKIDKIDNVKFENCSDRNLFSDNFLVYGMHYLYTAIYYSQYILYDSRLI